MSRHLYGMSVMIVTRLGWYGFELMSPDLDCIKRADVTGLGLYGTELMLRDVDCKGVS